MACEKTHKNIFFFKTLEVCQTSYVKNNIHKSFLQFKHITMYDELDKINQQYFFYKEKKMLKNILQ